MIGLQLSPLSMRIIFKNSDTYYDGGIALHMLVERKDVEIFCATLKEEYEEFKKKFKVAEYKSEYVIHQVGDVEKKKCDSPTAG